MTVVLQRSVKHREQFARIAMFRCELTGVEIASSRRFLARAGQFILSRIDARKGAIAIVPSTMDGTIVTNDFPVFDCDSHVLIPEYLGWLSRTARFVENCERASEGTTNRVRIKEATFLSLEFPLPPLSEQRRVVARIEELSAQIHEARTLRHQATIEANLLLSNRRRDCFKVQENSLVQKLEDVCEEIIDTLHSDPVYADDGVPCVRSPDIKDEVLNLKNARRTSVDEYKRRTVRGVPREGDIVYCRQGGGTGRAADVKAGDQFSLGQAMMLLRPNGRIIEPRFFCISFWHPQSLIVSLNHALLGLRLRASTLARYESSSSSCRLSLSNAVSWAELDALQAEVDALKRLRAETSAELDALLPAILDRAFKGEL